jgi:hypothetical protein
MQSDQPKPAANSEEKQKSTVQSQESGANDDHVEAAADQVALKSAEASNESGNHPETKSNEEKRSDDVKPFENIPKNVDVQQ